MLEKDLQEIGLNEKEAKIYLAALESGQSTVQQIAKKAGVNRATAYFIIEGLTRQGLISSFHKEKKQYFIAADPDKLSDILKQQENEINKRRENLKKLMPHLQSLNTKHIDKPVVKYYEGKEGLLTMSEELIKKAKSDIYMAYSVDAINTIFTDAEKGSARQRRVQKGVKTKVLYTYKDGFLESTKDGQRKKIPFDKFPLTCDLAIYDDFVRIASLGKKLAGIVIEDKEIASSLRSIFDLAWEAAEKYKK